MKKIAKIIFPFVFVLFSFVAFAQERKEKETFDFVQQGGEFPGGMDSLQSFLQKNLVYPDSAQKNGIEGNVFVGFIIEKDGSISDFKIVSKMMLGYGLEEEAIRVVKMMPNWKPFKQNGNPVRVRHTLPITFKLN